MVKRLLIALTGLLGLWLTQAAPMHVPENCSYFNRGSGIKVTGILTVKEGTFILRNRNQIRNLDLSECSIIMEPTQLCNLLRALPHLRQLSLNTNPYSYGSKSLISQLQYGRISIRRARVVQEGYLKQIFIFLKNYKPLANRLHSLSLANQDTYKKVEGFLPYVTQLSVNLGYFNNFPKLRYLNLGLIRAHNISEPLQLEELEYLALRVEDSRILNDDISRRTICRLLKESIRYSPRLTYLILIKPAKIRLKRILPRDTSITNVIIAHPTNNLDFVEGIRKLSSLETLIIYNCPSDDAKNLLHKILKTLYLGGSLPHLERFKGYITQQKKLISLNQAFSLTQEPQEEVPCYLRPLKFQ